MLDARGKIVTPGWIDIHVHVYDGVAPLGIPADPNCVAKGVTTVVDAGSAGAHTFPGLRKYVINVADTRVFALLNISVVGQSTLSPDNPWGELLAPSSRFNPTAFQAVSFKRWLTIGGWRNIGMAGTQSTISNITSFGSRSIDTRFCVGG